MQRFHQQAVHQLCKALDTAIAQAAEGSFTKLAAECGSLERSAQSLLASYRTRDGRPPTDPDLVAASRSLRDKAYTLSEIMRHIGAVGTSLLGVAGDASGSYGRDGTFERHAERGVQAEA